MNVRVIAATNRDLQKAIAADAFRQDLFYRLNVFPIQVPPLRERREDIPMLVDYFVDRFARKTAKKIRGIKKCAIDLLVFYDWPGNIRELQNVIERAVILCEGDTLTVDETWLMQPAPPNHSVEATLSRKSPAEEKELIEKALMESGGRVSGSSGAAAKLCIAASTLEYKIRQLKINKHNFKNYLQDES
jgi:transcriptional regulator with PAS, ATPase and Fis domain